MKKTEIKAGLKEIKTQIALFREELPSLLFPLEEVIEHLEALEDIEANEGIDMGIDFVDIKANILKDTLEESESWGCIEGTFDDLLGEFEGWLKDVSENKAEKIQETYIDQLENIKDELCLDEVEDEGSLVDMLIGIENQIDEFEFL